MDSKATKFVFKSFEVLADKKTVLFHYSTILNDENTIDFTEKIRLPKEIPATTNKDVLQRILANLHLVIGISYWKMYCQKELLIPYKHTQEQAAFWNTVYTDGLGEFFYKNKVDYRGLIKFPVNMTYMSYKTHMSNNMTNMSHKSYLIGIGGGKDSIVAVERLKAEGKKVTGYILKDDGNRSTVQEDVLKIMKINYLVVIRQLDKKLLNPVDIPQPYNGHIPVTAIYSFVSLLLAVIYGYSNVVISNGKSANSGNIEYLGKMINHQWSKSEEFEHLFQSYLSSYITSEVSYGSNIRSMGELEIMKEFVKYPQYFSHFSSCNRNFKITGEKQSKLWCGMCPKCAFVFTILSVYLPKDKVVEIFHKNLLTDISLLETYKGLLGMTAMKPFDCVGTFEETQEAFRIIKNKGEYKDDYIIRNL